MTRTPISKLNKEKTYLIHLECTLAGSAIAQGLTLMRKSNFITTGYGLQAFFMITIGLERLLKLILIYDFRRNNNNQFPNKGYLKKFSRNISDLFEKALEIADYNELHDLKSEVQKDPIYKQIIEFLSRFAKYARYNNLDQLEGNACQEIVPLDDWDEVINQEILQRHFKASPQHKKAIAEIGSKISDLLLVNIKANGGKQISSTQSLFNEGISIEAKQKYSVFYVYKIVHFLSKSLECLDLYHDPYIKEYFQLFSYPPQTMKGKKSWDIYKPY